MSFNGAAFLKDEIGLAKWEIHKRGGVINALWWKFMPGAKVTVKWPTGWTRPVTAAGGGFIQMESADPNDHFRPWLEENVGRQGWDWDWRIGKITGAQGSGNGPIVLASDTLTIKFRQARRKYATMFKLIWPD